MSLKKITVAVLEDIAGQIEQFLPPRHLNPPQVQSAVDVLPSWPGSGFDR